MNEKNTAAAALAAAAAAFWQQQQQQGLVDTSSQSTDLSKLNPGSYSAGSSTALLNLQHLELLQQQHHQMLSNQESLFQLGRENPLILAEILNRFGPSGFCLPSHSFQPPTQPSFSPNNLQLLQKAALLAAKKSETGRVTGDSPNTSVSSTSPSGESENKSNNNKRPYLKFSMDSILSSDLKSTCSSSSSSSASSDGASMSPDRSAKRFCHSIGAKKENENETTAERSKSPLKFIPPSSISSYPPTRIQLNFNNRIAGDVVTGNLPSPSFHQNSQQLYSIGLGIFSIVFLFTHTPRALELNMFLLNLIRINE